MPLPTGFTDASASALPLHVVSRADFAAWRDAQPAHVGAWTQAQGFDGSAGSALTLPGADGQMAGAVIGVGDALDPYSYGHAPTALPARAWALASPLVPEQRAALQLGWGLGSYRFNRYKQPLRQPAQLVLDGDTGELTDVLAACLRTRDLINTPTEHMGPDQLEQVACEIAERHGAHIEVISGDDLLAKNVFAVEDIVAGLASGRFLASDLAWREGMAAWTPLGDWAEFRGVGVPTVVTSMPFSMPASDSRSASRSTGTTRPLSVPTATPMS